jgi:hypothetical protein
MYFIVIPLQVLVSKPYSYSVVSNLLLYAWNPGIIIPTGLICRFISLTGKSARGMVLMELRVITGQEQKWKKN